MKLAWASRVWTRLSGRARDAWAIRVGLSEPGFRRTLIMMGTAQWIFIVSHYKHDETGRRLHASSIPSV